MSAIGTTNITTNFRERQFAAYHDNSKPESWYRHTPPAYTGPTPIVFPGTLTTLEQNEVNAWLVATDATRPAALSRCTQRAAIAKITEYIAFYADPDWLAWSDLNNAVRLKLWPLFMADVSISSKATVSASADPAGTGSDEITVIGDIENTPD